MENFFKNLKSFFGFKEYKIVMLGLDASGKTSILYKIKHGKNEQVIPTIGFNVENINFEGFNLNIWDVGSPEKIRPLWKHYLDDIAALIFVIDSSNTERFEIVKLELNHLFLNEKLFNKPVLIYSNKQDVGNNPSNQDLINLFELNNYSNINWNIQSSSILEGNGINEGLKWIINHF